VSRAATAPPEPAPTLAGFQDEFERAARAAGGTVDLRLTVAGSAVRIRFAGAAAAEALGRAFAHLVTGDDEPASLTLHVWDCDAEPAETTTSWAGASYFYDEPGFLALHQPATDVLSVLAADGDVGWYRMPDATRLPFWEYTAPFRHLLGWWLDAQGCRQVHGGAVGTEAGGVLVVGPGGSGKSTTAVASLLDERLRYAGDDYVAVGGDRDPVVHSLYCSAKVRHEDMHRLPNLVPELAAGDRADEKVVFYLATALPGRSISEFPLRAIVVPRLTDRRTARVLPGTRSAALAALAPSTIFQLHPPGGAALADLAQLVRTVPSFVLELGADVETIPRELVRLLEQLP